MPSAPHPDDRRAIFDNWAADYDTSVDEIAQAQDFPFAGYDDVMRVIVERAGPGAGRRALDLGTGTGELARRLLDSGWGVTGTDSSAAMLKKARAKLSEITLIESDLLDEVWPAELDGPFDAITSAYVLHEFPLPRKIEILKRCAERLTPGGRIVIGDVAFLTRAALDEAHQRWRDRWDEGEHYWAADETLDAAGFEGLTGAWHGVSACAGVFVFTPTPG